MAKNPRNPSDAVAQAAEAAMPGWKAIKETPLEASRRDRYSADATTSDPGNAADAIMPSTEQLRAKYLGATQRDSAAPQSSSDVARDEADTALVEMESGPLKKTVAVSKSKKKVIWSQG